MPYASSHGNRIHYEVAGRGDPAVVLLHSYFCSVYMWHNQVERLAQAYTVVNIDARGHGDSDKISEPFALEDMVDDVVAVLDVEAIQDAVWVGLSIGGMVALRAALTVPERVRALIIIDSDAGAESMWGRVKYSMMAAVVRHVSLRPVLRSIVKLMFGRTTLRSRPELVREWTARFHDVHVPSMLNTLPALMARRDLLPRLGEIRVPTLIIVGEEDRSLPPHRSRMMASAIPDSRFVRVGQAGHLSVLEAPDGITELLFAFLEKASVTR